MALLGEYRVNLNREVGYNPDRPNVSRRRMVAFAPAELPGPVPDHGSEPPSAGVAVLQRAARESAVAEEAQDLQAMAEVADAAQPGLGADLSALALISLGSTEFWATARA